MWYDIAMSFDGYGEIPTDFVVNDSGLFVPESVVSAAPEISERLKLAVPPEGTQNYFFNPYARKDIYDFAKRTTEYALDNGIDSVVLIDRSARPFSTALKTYWDLTIDNPEEQPDIFFINPSGFTKRNIGLLATKGAITQRFSEDHPFLFAKKDKPVLLFDTCIHGGDTIKPVLKGFIKAGFSDVKLGVVSTAEKRTQIEPDFDLLKNIAPELWCYPFGSEELVDHTQATLHAKVDDNPTYNYSSRLRKEIRRIVVEQYLAEQTGTRPELPESSLASLFRTIMDGFSESA